LGGGSDGGPVVGYVIEERFSIGCPLRGLSDRTAGPGCEISVATLEGLVVDFFGERGTSSVPVAGEGFEEGKIRTVFGDC
jgi:hypothetical protein